VIPPAVIYIGLGVIVYLAFLVGLIGVYRALYHKVGPYEVLVISGRKGDVITDENGDRRQLGFRIVKGGGSLVNPIIERVEVMSLEMITLDVITPEIRTKTGASVRIDALAQVKVRSDDTSVRIAAEQYMNKTRDEVKQIANHIITSHLRAVVCMMTIDEFHAKRSVVAQEVAEASSSNLGHMGMEVVSFTIREIIDDRGRVEAIAEVDANRDEAIRMSQASQGVIG
jgi:flotillin